MHGYDGFGMGFGWFGLVFIVILIVVVVWVISMVMRNSSMKNRMDNNSYGNHSKTSMEILNERYAKGEIDDEEYERRRSKLQGRI